MTISSNTAVCERGFSCMNREKSVMRTRLGENTFDHIMCINIDDSSLDNIDTEKFVSDWIEPAVTSRHLNGQNSSRTETQEEADENVIVLSEQNKIKTLQDLFFFFYLDDVKSFSALVDMNYLIVESVDNTIEANYRILYPLLQ